MFCMQFTYCTVLHRIVLHDIALHCMVWYACIDLLYACMRGMHGMHSMSCMYWRHYWCYMYFDVFCRLSACVYAFMIALYCFVLHAHA